MMQPENRALEIRFKESRALQNALVALALSQQLALPLAWTWRLVLAILPFSTHSE